MKIDIISLIARCVMWPFIWASKKMTDSVIEEYEDGFGYRK